MTAGICLMNLLKLYYVSNTSEKFNEYDGKLWNIIEEENISKSV